MSYSIHWLCNAPSPYNDFLFRSLDANSAINLKVHFKEKYLASHPWNRPMAQGFPSRYYNKTFGLDWELIALAMKDEDSLFVLGGWNNFTIWAVLNILMIRKRPFILWTDTPNVEKHRMMLKDKLRSHWLKIIFNNAVAVMGTGKPGCEALENIGCSKEKIFNFPYWTQLPQEWDDDKAITKTSTIFFSIGRLDRIKGYDLAIRAFDKAVLSVKQKNMEYWIFGDGPERNTLEGLAKKLNITEMIKFWGWQDPAFIQKEIKKADVFIHPALWEPYGVVVLEAMAQGKPVMASDKTMAALDRIQPGINGFIHTTGDTEQMAEQMSFFIQRPDQIDKMGKGARHTAVEWPVERGVEIIKKIAVGSSLKVHLARRPRKIK